MDDNCSICVESLDTDSNNQFSLNCRHIFHPYCILRWLAMTSKSEPECPLCKQTIALSTATHLMCQWPNVTLTVIDEMNERYDIDMTQMIAKVLAIYDELQIVHHRKCVNTPFIPKFKNITHDSPSKALYAARIQYDLGVECLKQQLQVAQEFALFGRHNT
jgi:hypothetical protein